MNKIHWSKDFLNHSIQRIVALKKGWQHRTDLIKLDDGSAWVCKLFSSDTWLGVIQKKTLLMSEWLAKRLADQLSISYAAWQPSGEDNVSLNQEGSPLLKINDQFALIKPYCPGKQYRRVNSEQAFILGATLAKIHQLKLSHPDAREFPKINLDALKDEPNWFFLLADECNTNLHHQQEHWILSHRDLYHQNIIWQNTITPHFIDWESSGLIHPFIELIGLAINCANIDRNKFNKKLFQASLQGYKSIQGQLPQQDEQLWRLILHSWLLWYTYCVRHNLNEEMQLCMATIVKLLALTPTIQQLYC